jgi:hypothetical protein
VERKGDMPAPDYRYRRNCGPSGFWTRRGGRDPYRVPRPAQTDNSNLQNRTSAEIKVFAQFEQVLWRAQDMP